MSDAVARFERLLPEYADDRAYRGHFSGRRIDPQARAAVVRALRHFEIHADIFYRRDLIEAALQVAAPEVTTFRIAADIQRLLIRHTGLIACPRRLNKSGPILTTSTALGMEAVISLRIDRLRGAGVNVLKRSEALDRLRQDAEGRLFTVAPDRRTTAELLARTGVRAMLVKEWIAFMEPVLTGGPGEEKSRSFLEGRTLLVDRAWVLALVDVLLILEICEQADLDLILTDRTGRFGLGIPVHIWYNRSMPRLSKRGGGRRGVFAKPQPPVK